MAACVREKRRYVHRAGPQCPGYRRGREEGAPTCNREDTAWRTSIAGFAAHTHASLLPPCTSVPPGPQKLKYNVPRAAKFVNPAGLTAQHVHEIVAGQKHNKCVSNKHACFIPRRRNDYPPVWFRVFWRRRESCRMPPRTQRAASESTFLCSKLSCNRPAGTDATKIRTELDRWRRKCAGYKASMTMY